jgi:hypothetical protein
MPWIFSYSDFGPQIIKKVLDRAPFCSLPASLSGYKVSFKGSSRKWGGALATLEKERKSFVYGSILLLPLEDIKVIDKYYRLYEKLLVPIFIDATQDKVKAHVYVLKSATAKYGKPSDEYTSAIVKHLKFFWGQSSGRSVSLSDFGISTEIPEVKEIKKPKPPEPPKVEVQIPVKAKPKRRATRKRKPSKSK